MSMYVFENFDHNDVDATYSGDLEYFATTDTRSVDGDYALTNAQTATDDADRMITRTDYDFVQGDSFEWWWYAPSTSIDDVSHSFLFGVTGDTGAGDIDGYEAFMDADGTMSLYYFVSGDWNDITLDTDNSPDDYPSDEWVRFHVHWQTDDTITFRAYDDGGTELGWVEATDDQYNSGGFGWNMYRADEQYIDALASDSDAIVTDVTGVVELDDGTPLEGAEITAILETNEIGARTTAGVDGSYTIELPEGTIAHLTMEYDGPEGAYNDQSKPFIIAE